MAVYLIRHAHAGSRSAWQGDDRERPLSKKGRRQSAALAESLRDDAVGRVLSSPATRCVETVEPIAAQADVAVEASPELREGADAEAVVEMVLNLAGKNPVICGHGDLIPKIVRNFMADGMKADQGAISQKGSIWVIEVVDGRARKGTYVPPP